ncbi:MAG: hypothetical protein NT007_06125 [Candidatus Kapabacteria bacterium]|nr:hypothetical protein [Candidatus Kapabacteria bacterium]
MMKIIILLTILQSYAFSKENFWDLLYFQKDSTQEIESITFDKNGNIYFAAFTYGSIYKSTNHGKSWEIIFDRIPQCLFVSSNNYLFSSTNYYCPCLYRSKDGGKTWDTTKLATVFGTIYQDYNGMRVTNFIELGDGTILAGHHDFSWYYFTSDQGDSWYDIYMGDKASDCQGIAVNNLGELFCLSSQDYAIQKSIDTGKTWKYVRKPIDCTTCPDQYVPILFNPKSDCGISSDYSDKVISRDNGNTWVKDTGYLYFNYEPLYRPFALDSMYNFITSGTHWDTTIKDFKYDIRRYKSDLSSFEDISDTMIIKTNSDKPSCIETSPDGYIYVGMRDGRLFRSHQKYVSVKEPEPQQPAGIKISPNPACDFINISQPSEGLKPSEGSLIRIYNMLGEEIKNLTQTSGDLTPGPSPKERGGRIDVSALPEGVYYIRVGNVNGAVFVVGR